MENEAEINLHWNDVTREPPKILWVACEIQTARNGQGDGVEYVVQSATSITSAEDALKKVKLWVIRDIQPSRRYEVVEYIMSKVFV